MIRAYYIKHILRFERPVGTSRGVLHEKECWYLVLRQENEISGIGEVSYIPGLCRINPAEIEAELQALCGQINDMEADPYKINPAIAGIRFALETALQGVDAGSSFRLYPSAFAEGEEGIPINGLIWMGSPEFMLNQVHDKISKGFSVLKFKVGAIGIQEELDLLHKIRSEYSSEDLEIRLDANGAWTPEEAKTNMESFASFRIHSIEQPIKAGQVEAMAVLCSDPAIPVALDEELIGIDKEVEIKEMLDVIQPQYIILKPSLIGGLQKSELFIREAEKRGIDWWITSALESNVGLNAIAQWTFTLNNELYQGLGTGQLFTNNIPSPLSIKNALLNYGDNNEWNLEAVINE